MRRGLLAVATGLLLAACVPASAMGQQAQNASVASVAPTPSSLTSIAAPSGSSEAAIEQVILRGNSEQEQAIARQEASVMQDMSTDSYYQELGQANQDLLDSGATAIKVIRIEWGPVAVSGTTATATTYETWTTDYSDGTTDEMRDRNVYTLGQQDGAQAVLPRVSRSGRPSRLA